MRSFDKGYYLKRLFDKQETRVDPRLSFEQRQDESAKLMDQLVGPRWREEVNKSGMDLVQVDPIPHSQEVAEFWYGVQQLGYKEGFGTENVEHDPAVDQPDPPPPCGCHPRPSPQVVILLRKLLNGSRGKKA